MIRAKVSPFRFIAYGSEQMTPHLRTTSRQRQLRWLGVKKTGNAYLEQQDLPVGSDPLQHLPTPTFRKIISSGQKLVKED